MIAQIWTRKISFNIKTQASSNSNSKIFVSKIGWRLCFSKEDASALSMQISNNATLWASKNPWTFQSALQFKPGWL